MMLVSIVLNIYRVMLNYKIFDNLDEGWGILHQKSCTFHEGASKLSVCVFSILSENLTYKLMSETAVSIPICLQHVVTPSR